jgi:hypothetical protein
MVTNITAADAYSVGVSGSVVDRSGHSLNAQTRIINQVDNSQLHSATVDSAGDFNYAIDAVSDVAIEVYQAYSPSNNAVSVYDALDAFKIAIGLNPSNGAVTGEQLITADIDQDARVTGYDALDILKAAIGITTNNLPEWNFIDTATDLSGLTSGEVH